MADAGFNGLGIFKQQLREDIFRAARGFIAETIDARLGVSTGVMGAAGIISYAPVVLFAGEKISNLTIYVFSAAAGLTVARLALYSSTGLQLAVTGDLSASWQSTGAKTAALVTPYTPSAAGVYYVGGFDSGTTGPTIIRGSGGSVFGSFLMPGFTASHHFGQTGQVDLPAQATFTTGLASHDFWCGLS